MVLFEFHPISFHEMRNSGIGVSETLEFQRRGGSLPTCGDETEDVLMESEALFCSEGPSGCLITSRI